LKFLKYKKDQISGLRDCDEDTGEQRMEPESCCSKDSKLTAETFYFMFVEKLKDVMLPQHYEQYVKSFENEDKEKRNTQKSTSFVDLLSCYDKKRRKRKLESSSIVENHINSKKDSAFRTDEDDEMKKQFDFVSDVHQRGYEGGDISSTSTFSFSFDL
jgi:hypothetical protein